MLRVALEADPGRPICMPFGYEVAVPMHFGAVNFADPSQLVDFSAPRQMLPAERKEYSLHWDNEDMRSVLMEEFVAVHYFGNPMARSRDDENVRKGVVPEYNNKRLRVAAVWGDYLYSDQHGHYTTIRIRVPDMPRVTISPVTQSGVIVAGSYEYRPHAFLKFEELLSADAEAEMAALQSRRPRVFQSPQSIDIAKLTPQQIAALAQQLSAYAATQNSERAGEAFRQHREDVKVKMAARAANGG